MYEAMFKDGMYHLWEDQQTLCTPAGNPVTAEQSCLAERLVQHLEQYGKDPENRCSVLLFHYPRLDLVQHYPRGRIVRLILTYLDLKFEWEIRDEAPSGTAPAEPSGKSSPGQFRTAEAREWLKNLSLNQLCATLVLSKILGSMNHVLWVSRLQGSTATDGLIRQLILREPLLGKEPLAELLANFRFYWEL